MEYKVTGDQDVLGHAPGDTFDADIPEAQEARLVARGAIEPLGTREPTPKVPDMFGTGGATNTGEDSPEEGTEL